MADYRNNRADRSSRRPAPASREPAPQVDPRTGRTGFPRPNVAATNASAGNRADRSSVRPTSGVSNIPPGAQNAPGWAPPAPSFNPGAPYQSRFPQPIGPRGLGTMQPQDARLPGIGSQPASAGFAPGEGAAYQRALEGAQKSGGTPPPPGRPTAGEPAVRSGFSQQRIDPSTGTQIAGQTAFGAGFSPLANPQIDWNSLQKSINGEGWTNAGVVAGTQTDMNGSVKNPFAESQLTPAQPLIPGTPGFAPGMPSLGGALAGAGNVPMSASSPTPGVVPAAFTPGLELGGAVAEATPVVDATVPAESAQEFALGALQDQIRRNRLDLR